MRKEKKIVVLLLYTYIYLKNVLSTPICIKRTWNQFF